MQFLNKSIFSKELLLAQVQKSKSIFWSNLMLHDSIKFNFLLLSFYPPSEIVYHMLNGFSEFIRARPPLQKSKFQLHRDSISLPVYNKMSLTG